jgi:SpoIID/LytB domain protein
VTLDNYVKGVVPAEMPASWRPEAVQAQAVAARTYAWWSRAQFPDRYYQICDTTSCQVYKGLRREHPAANTAVDATRGQILTYGGEPAFTQFSASSGGRTSAGGFPYLPSKGDPYDAWSGNSVHSWSVKVSETALEKRYPGIGDLKKIKVTSREGGGDWNGGSGTWTLDRRQRVEDVVTGKRTSVRSTACGRRTSRSGVDEHRPVQLCPRRS